MDLLEVCRRFIDDFPNQRYLIAYSGGKDSHVLLHLFSRLGQLPSASISVRAAHINHNVHSDSSVWVAHCEAVCQSLDIPFIHKVLDDEPRKGESFEAYARRVRYRQLTEILEPDEILLTAHHAGDQAETVLLQLFRGSGPKGLSAMPSVKGLGNGALQGRPLLAVSREQIDDYANKHQLKWVEDSSNQDTYYRRNFIRHEVLPLIQTRWPAAEEMLSRAAKHAAEYVSLVDDCLNDEFSIHYCPKTSTLNIPSLRELPTSQQVWVLRQWCERLTGYFPDSKRLAEIQDSVMSSGIDASPCVEWGQHDIRRYRDQLYLLQRLPGLANGLQLAFNNESSCILPNTVKLEFKRRESVDFTSHDSAPNLALVFNQKQYRYRLSSHSPRRSLKYCYQTWGVPPWWRQYTPMLIKDGQCIAVGRVLRQIQDGLEVDWVQVFE